jgi:hypothetical protein
VPPNKQLERTVIRRRGRAASAPFHYAHAARFIRQRAAAELQRSATQRSLVYRVLVASSVLIGSSTGAAELRDVIPEHFRGTWAGSWMHCTFGGESTLTIGERTVDSYESRGRVLSIATEGDTELGLLVEATGEGQTSLVAIKFTLSQDRQTLLFSVGGERIERTRCEAKKTNN